MNRSSPYPSPPHLPVWIATLTLLASLTPAVPVPAQKGTPEGGIFTDTLEVSVVNLDVFVTDKKGRPVTGLGRDDFEILVDGKRVEVSNFAAIAGPAEMAAPEGEAERLVPETAPEQAPAKAEPPREPLYLVAFVDNQHLRPRTRKEVLGHLRRFLTEDLLPQDQVMIVSAYGSLKIRQDFTDDREVLARALDEIEKDPSGGIREDREMAVLLKEIEAAPNDADLLPQIQERVESSIANLDEERAAKAKVTLRLMETLVAALAELPARKALIHVSDGISIELEAHELRRLVAHANADRVTFYTLNGGGSRTFSTRSAAASSRIQLLWDEDRARARTFAREAALRDLSQGTGGVALSQGQGLATGLSGLRAQLDAYYSLAYSPKNPRDGKDHQIEIKVAGGDYRLRYPRSFRIKSADEKLEDQVLGALHLGVQENPLEARLEVGPVGPAKKRKKTFVVPFLIRFPMSKIVLLPEARHHRGSLTIVYAVRDQDGAASEIFKGALPIEIPTRDLEAALARDGGYQVNLAVTTGPKRVAFAVRDDVGRTVSTLLKNFEIDPEMDPGKSR